jgi:hypothetical protein
MGTRRRAIASSSADKSEQVVVVPAGVEAFALDSDLNALVSLE